MLTAPGGWKTGIAASQPTTWSFTGAAKASNRILRVWTFLDNHAACGGSPGGPVTVGRAVSSGTEMLHIWLTATSPKRTHGPRREFAIADLRRAGRKLVSALHSGGVEAQSGRGGLHASLARSLGGREPPAHGERRERPLSRSRGSTPPRPAFHPSGAPPDRVETFRCIAACRALKCCSAALHAK